MKKWQSHSLRARLSAFLIATLLLASLSFLASCDRKRSAESAKQEQPNVILISIDTARADHMSLYGYSRPTTPHLERFARSAVVFERAYANASYTLSSHMSIFTGLYPQRHGVFYPVTSGRSETETFEALSPTIRTLPELLREAGYRTARFVHSRDYFLDPALGFGRGFDENHPYGLDAQWSVDRVKGWLDRWLEGDRRKFFLFLHSKRAHLPYVVPQEYAKLYDPDYKGPIESDPEAIEAKLRRSGMRWLWSTLPGIYPEQVEFMSLVDRNDKREMRHLEALYDGALTYTDRLVGGLLDHLESRGFLKNTIVIVTSDHGEEFMDHGGVAHLTVHEEILRVPLVIRFPSEGKFAIPARRAGELAQSVDLLPTLRDALGLPARSSQAPESDGISLMPILRGEKTSPRPFIYAHHRYRGMPTLDSIRTDDWKLILRDDGTRALYDIRKDPKEKQDVSGAHPDVLNRLRAEVRKLGLKN